ncbi:uncharacterized protein DMENIID0001_018420 [Sergentomyia squamirostris]
MEEKLQAYRRKKRREEAIQGFKEKIFNMVSFHQIRVDSSKPEEKAEEHVSIDAPETEIVLGSEEEVLVDTVEASGNVPETSEMALGAPKRTAFTYFIYMLYFLLWVTCYAIAIELQFGLVFFLFSALAAVYLNTRTRPKHAGEISAYSVFNKDCHAIDGTLKAEQFEAELRYAALK